MWRFKPFMPKEQNGLEGRTIDIGNFKVQVRNAIAEGGFSYVYLARDAIHVSKQYAVKHIICNDEESLELVMKETSVMKSLKGHPNIVTLHAHTILDMGRTKEALLLMEYCEKSLVNVLESRGAGIFEEKQILQIFRDVCNAVFAMHCKTPPIAHRDLKAENLLLGSDGLWKLCDFGSTSTNHKRFEKPEEMGIEEDNIRKHTTPAYRAPEMWDLYRRELINEKVDIWALGCLLFRICYFKSAFDGESKLQILNGNYRIPDLPKYSASLTDIIRDMLHSSPDDRPDITQVWFRVNGLLPDGLQKSLPDRPPEIPQQNAAVHGGMARPLKKSNPMPCRSPPPPPLAEAPQNISSQPHNQETDGSTGSLGAFWTTQHAKDSVGQEDKARPKYDEEFPDNSKSNPTSHVMISRKEENLQSQHVQEKAQARSVNGPGNDPSKDFKINLFPDDSDHNRGRSKLTKPEQKPTFQNEVFNTFVAEFDTNKLSPGSYCGKSAKEELLEAEIEKLKEQLTVAYTEKAEITSKYEKLSAICKSQRQEMQDLKQVLAVRTPSPSRDVSRNQASPGSQPSTTEQTGKIEGTVQELQQGFFDQSSASPDPQSWKAFTDDTKLQTTSTKSTPKSVRTRNGNQNRKNVELNSGANTWGFGTDNFKAAPSTSPQFNLRVDELNNSQRFSESKNGESKLASHPAGWAGF
ncbi:probable serine threonine- kinase DDB_G0280111 [Olea europaea subsp. europaea]|uniref:non-specific serine/threonine protein kinase n=1 Tax=Olea europaea subsp. europaea TaxID=158383 RepID=A0A8S0U0K9_OLEEU|nr:probable serine threonine- kinase DDB_G0280111 [Olea europaea subsp. europaea]